MDNPGFTKSEDDITIASVKDDLGASVVFVTSNYIDSPKESSRTPKTDEVDKNGKSIESEEEKDQTDKGMLIATETPEGAEVFTKSEDDITIASVKDDLGASVVFVTSNPEESSTTPKTDEVDKNGKSIESEEEKDQTDKGMLFATETPEGAEVTIESELPTAEETEAEDGTIDEHSQLEPSLPVTNTTQIVAEVHPEPSSSNEDLSEIRSDSPPAYSLPTAEKTHERIQENSAMPQEGYSGTNGLPVSSEQTAKVQDVIYTEETNGKPNQLNGHPNGAVTVLQMKIEEPESDQTVSRRTHSLWHWLFLCILFVGTVVALTLGLIYGR